MNLSIEFKQPEMTSAFDWQLTQEVNVKDENKNVIAKAEIELITLNKHRDASKSYEMLEQQLGNTDWEIPLNVYFKGQNLDSNLCETLSVSADTKKAKSHIMLEAISVQPNYRKQGVAKYLITEIMKHYPKAQSITAFSMPLAEFVDPEDCEDSRNKTYYTQLQLENNEQSQEELAKFFKQVGFIEYKVDDSLLAEPLTFDIFVASQSTIIQCDE
ncbi:GNAT family N-acetyltransferase [Litorilituus lipolyticus]|uniref:GNAT family N-acetyltransferase n=1 Tax=Litorilituus lipolyticus TaxID=2491017 RepID=A0A502KTB5_9GAMM|nr:GNAT family N-acetyltransferase [Litorilituus lipolyticus]TPH12913.1 GNAT family N-acetyltransferase [Litorilituus lipolyticus]